MDTMTPENLLNSIEMRNAIKAGAKVPAYLLNWAGKLYNSESRAPFTDEEVDYWTGYACMYSLPEPKVDLGLRSGDYHRAVMEAYPHQNQFEPPPTIRPLFRKNKLVGFSAEVAAMDMAHIERVMNEVGRTLRCVNELSPDIWREQQGEA